MKAIHFISVISRVSLIIALVLGLLSWVAQGFGWGGLLMFLAQIGFLGTHEGFGILGVLGLFILGCVAVSIRESRWLGVGSILSALLIPAFGLTQTMILVGTLHWLIQVAHLLVGVGAMMLILMVEKRTRARSAQNTLSLAGPRANRFDLKKER